MSFFRNRLEAFPRLADYRLAKAAGYWPYYKTVESASRPRFTIEGHDYINFGSNNYLSLSYHPRVIEAAQRATGEVRHRRHRLPACSTAPSTSTAPSKPSWPSSTAAKRRWSSPPVTSPTWARSPGS